MGVGVRVCGCGCTCVWLWVYVCVGGLCVGGQGVCNCESTRLEIHACEGLYSCVCEMGARMLTRVNTRLVYLHEWKYVFPKKVFFAKEPYKTDYILQQRPRLVYSHEWKYVFPKKVSFAKESYKKDYILQKRPQFVYSHECKYVFPKKCLHG